MEKNFLQSSKGLLIQNQHIMTFLCSDVSQENCVDIKKHKTKRLSNLTHF